MTDDAGSSHDAEARQHRERLLVEIARRSRPWPGEAWSPAVLDAMGKVPRHAFVPELSLAAAYKDAPQSIGHGQTISQPTVVAMMTQALDLSPTAKVLEIGTGSGYQAAVLASLAGHVFTIELHAPLAESATAKLARAGYSNVTVRAGDGYAGWPSEAPFDRVILTAAPAQLPQALVDQLAVGGILVAPVGPEGELQRLHRHRKLLAGDPAAEGAGGRALKCHDGTGRACVLTDEDLGGVMFVPMVRGQ